jgi:hypothetical protein
LSREVAENIAARAHAQYRLSRDRILLTSSHTHTGPAIAGNLPLMQPTDPDMRAATARYSRDLAHRLVAVIGQAIDGLEPAELSYHIGRAGFAMNRRERAADGTIKLGDNPAGRVDHSVPTLRVSSANGKLLAALFSYAAHNTTLTGRHYELHGDYAGEAQLHFEQAHPGALALFMMGCGGDANPGARGTLEDAQAHGRELSQAVSQAIAAAGRPVRGALWTHFERFPIPLETPPTPEQWRSRAELPQDPEQQLAAYLVARLDSGRPLPHSYPFPLQRLRLGDAVTLIALGGEVVVDYGLNLKRSLGDRTTWVVAYSNDVFAYIPTAAILSEGGYEAERSQMWYGMPAKWDPAIEQTILERARAVGEPD